MISKIPDEIFGAWMATKDDILAMNRTAIMNEWGGSFEEESLERILDESAHHLLVPLLVNHPKNSNQNNYRCLLWLKVASENTRISAMMDCGISDIRSLERPPERGLHSIIVMLLECCQLLNLVNIDEYVKAETVPQAWIEN